ncbi:Bacterial virulence protein (VirJ) [compost metagenome]
MLKRNWWRLLLILAGAVLLASGDQHLTDAKLLALARNGNARLLQMELRGMDCAAQQQRLQQASIEVQGWLGKSGQAAATGPELARLPAAKVLCVFGKEKAAERGCTQDGAVGEKLELPDGHHYDENYLALAEKQLQTIDKRQGGQHKN